MAEPQYRSMNAELDEGSTDGKYKKLAPNRGNIFPPDRAAERQERTQLTPRYYGIDEAPTMRTPDGRVARRNPVNL